MKRTNICPLLSVLSPAFARMLSCSRLVSRSGCEKAWTGPRKDMRTQGCGRPHGSGPRERCGLLNHHAHRPTGRAQNWGQRTAGPTLGCRGLGNVLEGWRCLLRLRYLPRARPHTRPQSR
eukprot:1825086-Rhodomonas_salina.1